MHYALYDTHPLPRVVATPIGTGIGFLSIHCDEEGVFMFVSWQFSHHVQWAISMARKATATDG